MESKDLYVLVVDDSRMERLKLSRALASQGHTVTTAESGPLALDMLRTQSFDLVFLDIVMPEMDGYEVLSRLKSDDSLRTIPVIVISGLDDTQSIRSCLELGAEAHLAKPISADSLRGCVEAYFDKKHSRDQGR